MTGISDEAKRSRGAALLVWAVWVAMIGVALGSIAAWGRNIPWAEDWTLVRPLTGHEPSLLSWLWSQNQEHRIPLARAVYLLLLEATGGDFRAGMVFETLVLGLLAAAMVAAARTLRDGRTRLADAFFPLAFLHLGHWQNLVWGWQLNFVLAVAVACGLLLLVVWRPSPLTGSGAFLAALSLVLLPLSGAMGLVLLPPMTIWVGLEAGVAWAQGRRADTVVLVAGVVSAVVLVALYFVGYIPATWNPPSPGPVETLKTAAKCQALGLGPAASRSWPLSILLTVAVLASSVALVAIRALRARGTERLRPLGLLLFFAAAAVLDLALGWGRAALVPTVGLPMRYAVLAVPVLCAAFFAWELYGGPTSRRLVPAALALLMVLVLPANTANGLFARNWYRSGMDAFENDLDAGMPAALLADRHYKFLMHWDRDALEAGLRSLQQAGIGPFRRLGQRKPGDTSVRP